MQKTAIPIAGGALLIVTGVLGLAMWVPLIFAAGTVAGIPLVGTGFAEILAICGAIGAIFSILALLGGVMAVQRKMWGLGLIGGIFGLLSLGYVLGSILGLVGLILVAISKKEFQ